MRRQWLAWLSDIIKEMPATTTVQIFGPQEDRGVEVLLPMAFDDRHHRFLVEITDNRSPDQISWYTLWGEVKAIDSSCLKYGQVGTSVGLGVHGNLKLEVSLHLD